MKSPSAIQSGPHSKLICEFEDENPFLECSESFDPETLNEQTFQEYQRLTKKDSRPTNETRFKKPETKTTSDDIVLAGIVLGVGWLVGPVGFGIGALLLACGYSVEDIGVAEPNNNRSPQVKREAEAESEVEQKAGSEAEAEAEAENEPQHNTWIGISTEGAPSGLVAPTAVWTGSEMIVWGGGIGNGSAPGVGGRYDPDEDSWRPTSIDGSPSERGDHTAVWTGSEMIVWGGDSALNPGGFNDGGRYDPVRDSWSPTATAGAPPERYNHAAVWTGNEMILWGGYNGNTDLNTGGRYDPVRDRWSPTATTTITARDEYTAVWTGNEMIVWGGYSVVLNPNFDTVGGRYDPDEDSWRPTGRDGPPLGRYRHTAVWTGNEMIVWGGLGNTGFNTGGWYDPVSNSWFPTATTGAPLERTDHTAVWTGSEMIVWGGWDINHNRLNTGGGCSFADDSWTPTSLIDAPSERRNHIAVWTGNEMIVWGGNGSNGTAFDTGYRYIP